MYLVVRSGAGIDGGATELFAEPEVVAMIPDLDNLAVRKAEDVRPRKPHAAPRRLTGSPTPQVRTGGRPPTNDVVVFSNEQVDYEVEIGKGSAEVGCDLLLALGAGHRLRTPEIVPYVIRGEDLVADVEVAFVPNLFVEATDEGLVLLRRHQPSLLSFESSVKYCAAVPAARSSRDG